MASLLQTLVTFACQDVRLVLEFVKDGLHKHLRPGGDEAEADIMPDSCSKVSLVPQKKYLELLQGHDQRFNDRAMVARTKRCDQKAPGSS